MKLFGLLAVSASAATVEHPLFEQFKEWKNQFGKVYSTSTETTERFEKWLDNHQEHGSKSLSKKMYLLLNLQA